MNPKIQTQINRFLHKINFHERWQMIVESPWMGGKLGFAFGFAEYHDLSHIPLTRSR